MKSVGEGRESEGGKKVAGREVGHAGHASRPQHCVIGWEKRVSK